MGKLLIEVHISNGPGRRRKMHRGDFARGYDRQRFNDALEEKQPKLLRMIDKRVNRIQEFLADYDKARIVICPELEDNLSDRAFNVFARQVRENWQVAIVRNPCTAGDGGKFRLLEQHGHLGAFDGRSIWNPDGLSIKLPGESFYFNTMERSEFLRAATKAKNAFAILAWAHEQQGYYGSQNWGNPKPPKKRKFTVSDSAIAFFEQWMSDHSGSAFVGMSGFAAVHNRFPAKRFVRQYPRKLQKAGVAILPGTFGWSRKTLNLLYTRITDGE